ncbi:hypothetical protein BU17DRAFT_73482 [Hysterangium stoloniferum]|nr:hypothetical protein BU17DRAFT_73482 [Hysterangium stoloniferum]
MFTAILVAAFAVLPLVAGDDSCTRTYTVVENDFCDTISAANNVSTFQLAAVNPSINPGCTNLMPGQQLCLGTLGKDCTTVHVVQEGDTCNIITSNHGLNATMLVTNNPTINSECTNIYIGQVLCVANEVLAPEPPAGLSVPSPASGFGDTPASPVETIYNDPNAEVPFCDEM